MLITTPWLLKYLNQPIAHDALMEAFPRMGLEIEESSKLESGDGFKVDLNVLANRPDELGIIGIAREVAAHFNLKLKYPVDVSRATEPGDPSPVTVEIKDPDLCPRYIARAFTNVKIAPSPQWLQDILISIDQRPINNIVDITNFVMFEFGQPLHAFDLSKIVGRKIIVRKMERNERLELLGGKTIDAGKPDSPPTLVICDADKPIALAGIMGGKDSETRESSSEILLEAANFDPPTVRRTAKRIEVASESSYRFERGCDPNRMLEGALARASQLIAELARGKASGQRFDAYPKHREAKIFKLTPERVSVCLGTKIDAGTIKTSLEKLEMKVDADLTVHVPTWRMDATEAVVLIEDVARLVGYDKLPMTPTSQAPTMGARSATDQFRQAVAQYLSSSGFFEARSPSLEAPEQSDALKVDPKSLVRIKNPMTRESSVMRTNLLPALVRVAERNTRRNATTTRFFEMDKVYSKRTNDPKEVGAFEKPTLAAVAGGLLNEFDWGGKNPAINFFDLKGALEDVLEIAGVREAKFQPVDRVGFIKGTAAAIVPVADASNAIGFAIGFIGEIDGKVIDLGKMPFKLFGFEIDLEALMRTHAQVSAYQQLSRTPAVVRDLAIVVKHTENYAPVDRAIRELGGASLESLRIVDLYEGKPVPAGHKSLAFRLVFRDPARTLTAEEVQQQVDQIVSMLKEKFGATLRA